MIVRDILNKLCESMIYVTDEEIDFLVENLKEYVVNERTNHISGTGPRRLSRETQES